MEAVGSAQALDIFFKMKPMVSDDGLCVMHEKRRVCKDAPQILGLCTWRNGLTDELTYEEERLFKPFYPFLNWVVCLLLLNCRNIYFEVH